MYQKTLASELDGALQRNSEDELQVWYLSPGARRGFRGTRHRSCRWRLGLGLLLNQLFLPFQIFHRISPGDLFLWLVSLGGVVGKLLGQLGLTHCSPPPRSGIAGASRFPPLFSAS